MILSVAIEKTPSGPRIISGPVELPMFNDIEGFIFSWRKAQPKGSPLENVRITGRWEGWTIIRIQCHPASREPIAWRGVKVIDAEGTPLDPIVCDFEVTNSPKEGDIRDTRPVQPDRDESPAAPGAGTDEWDILFGPIRADLHDDEGPAPASGSDV